VSGVVVVVVVVVAEGTGELKKFLIRYAAAADAAKCHCSVQLISKWPAAKEVSTTNKGWLIAAINNALAASSQSRENFEDVDGDRIDFMFLNFTLLC
jgi:hypothetical protein